MALQSSGAISLGNIQTEFGGSNPIGLNEYQSTVGQSSGNNISISDFYGLSSSIHGTAISAAYVDGQYFDQSGYRKNFIGSITDATIDSFQSSTVCEITQVENLAGTLNFTISITSGSKTFSNSGFTTLNLYLGQTNSSGSADVALARSSATFSNGTNFGRWAWDVGTLGGNSSPTFVNGIFGTSTTNNFVEMV